jgi:hypothetical protein
LKQIQRTAVHARYLQFTETSAGDVKKIEVNCSHTIKDVYMKTVLGRWMKVLAFGSAVILFISCDDANEPGGKGNVQFEITDAPVDDANVKNVFVTVTDIKIDGKSIGGVVKTTLDLKAYTEGETKVIAMASQFDAKAYSNVSLVLDLNADENGAGPGCFVQMIDGTRYKLKNTIDGTMEVVVNKGFEVESSATTKVILDFDVRKAIAYDANDEVRYSFVNKDELSAAVRLMVRENSGTIKGLYTDGSPLTDKKIIAYAYRKGTFSASTETQAQGDTQIYFKNAEGSAEVKQGMNGREFTIAFLEEGDYELYFASYEKTPSGRTTFSEMLQAETSVDGTVGNRIAVEAGASISISTVVKGIL